MPFFAHGMMLKALKSKRMNHIILGYHWPLLGIDIQGSLVGRALPL